jgi:hypothetical protein
MSYASWPYNRGANNSVMALRAGLERLDADVTEPEDGGSYQASVASLVRAAREVAVERPQPARNKGRLRFPRA